MQQTSDRTRVSRRYGYAWLSVCRAVLSLMLAGIIASTANADDNRIARGLFIAQEKCGACHATGKTDDSPHRASPPLRDLQEDYPIPMLLEAAQTGVLSGHDEMPMFEFSRDDVEALLAFIDSLNPAGPAYLTKR
jgi:mono/diheme cytochrome c family protein